MEEVRKKEGNMQAERGSSCSVCKYVVSVTTSYIERHNIFVRPAGISHDTFGKGRQTFGHMALREEQLFLHCMGGMRHMESLAGRINGGFEY